MLLLLKIVAMEEMLLLLFKIEYDAIFIEDWLIDPSGVSTDCFSFFLFLFL
jgi:hypothetical protein